MGLYKWLKRELNYLAELRFYYLNAIKHSQSLRVRQNNLCRIGKSDIVLFSTMKNEAHRLPYFLDYYRRLGVCHFILVDNDSSDNFYDVVGQYSDVTAFHTKGSYKESNFGMHWMNYLLFRYGRGRWCLTCDPDEFLVYPNIETRDLKDLTQYLDSTLQCSFFTVMIDMYGKDPVSETVYQVGTDPLNACPYFDKSGYSKSINQGMRNLYVQGGVRKRVFSKDDPDGAPALNKVPLIKWKWNYAYVSSMHMALPRRLNRCVDERKTTGALLHYKFISQLDEKVKEELVAKQHYNDSAEYKLYGKVIDRQDCLYDPEVSTRYQDWKTLASLGLINTGEW